MTETISIFKPQTTSLNITDIKEIQFHIPKLWAEANRLIFGLLSLAATVLLIYPVILLPGLIILSLPGEIYVIGALYDRLVKQEGYSDKVTEKPTYWDNVDVSTEFARIETNAQRRFP